MKTRFKGYTCKDKKMLATFTNQVLENATKMMCESKGITMEEFHAKTRDGSKIPEEDQKLLAEAVLEMLAHVQADLITEILSEDDEDEDDDDTAAEAGFKCDDEGGEDKPYVPKKGKTNDVMYG